MGAIAVTAFCLLLLFFMRAVGAVTGSRTIGTVAGLSVVTLPLLVLIAIAIVAIVLVLGGVGLAIALPVGLWLACKRVGVSR